MSAPDTLQHAAYRIDGTLVSRAAFYAVACDPRRSLVVEACAGAGKTWMLVSRILRALLDGAEPQQVLAITFTKKAAAEMRHRLMEWLEEHATSSHEKRVQALLERGLSAPDAAAAAPVLGGLYERLLCGGQPVEIRTFHAWFSQLMRHAPLEVLDELGLAPQAELIEDTDELKPEVWRRFLAAVADDPALLEDFEALVHARGRHVAETWLLGVLGKRVEFELADAAGVVDASVPMAAELDPRCAGFEAPAAWLRSPVVSDVLGGVAAELGRQSNRTPQKQGAALRLALDLPDDLQALAAAEAALLNKDGELRRHLDAPGLDEAVAFLRDIRRAVGQHEAHVEHARMARLCRVLLAEYGRLKHARGLADMADLERCALRLLQDDVLAGWLQERLDARIQHVLIDEFQDTNPLQWQALSSWLSAYAGAGGGASGRQPPAVFIVGDPKQSIYRFRRAEPRVFEAAKELVVQGLGGAVLACDHTRRNAQGVLDAVNQVFGEAQAQSRYADYREHTTEVAGDEVAGEVACLERVERPAKAQKSQKAKAAAAGAVEAVHEEPVVAAPPGQDMGARAWRDSLLTPRIEPEEVLRMQEARRVAASIAQLIRNQGYVPGEVYVLSRRRTHLRVLADALRELHLPFATPEDSVLMDALEVRDLVALLDALVSPQHDLSLAHALRSPIFGASNEDLIALALAARGSRQSLWQALQTLHAAGAADASGAQASPALERAAPLLQQWAGLALRLPPHDLLDRIMAEGEIRERYAAAVPPEMREAALAHLDALLALSLELDAGRYATPYRLVRALRRRPLSVPLRTDSRAIQLLTIHGAKGLEAKVVFVMDADPEAETQDTASALVDWPAEAPHPTCFAFFASEGRLAPSLRQALDREREARAREELNGLYVAMTRARERLYFSATAPHRRSREPSWWERLAQAAPAVQHLPWAPADAGDAAQAGPPPEILLHSLPIWVRPPVPVPAEVAQADAALARVGEAAHLALDWLTRQPPVRGGIADAVAAAGRRHALDEDGRALAERMVTDVLGSPAFARFLGGPALRWAGNEVPMAFEQQVLRIDRLVQLEGEQGSQWWALDYKLSHAPQELAGYRAQLSRYRQAVQQAVAAQGSAADVRAAFVTGAGVVVELEADEAAAGLAGPLRIHRE